jgi:periplasmic mercuric ion binding protein
MKMKMKNLIKILIISLSLILMMNTSASAQDKKNAELKIKTSAICSQCKDRIEQGMAFEKGIKDVNLNVDTKIATVTYNPARTTPLDIRKAISRLGYDADTIPADKIAYSKLPPCCKKK